MQLEERNEAGHLVITCREDRLDALVAVSFKDRFRALVQHHSGGVVVDLSEVQFMDSSGLGALVAVYKSVGRERDFLLAGLTAPVARVLKLTRMDSVFSIFADVETALNSGMEVGDATRQAS